VLGRALLLTSVVGCAIAERGTTSDGGNKPIDSQFHPYYDAPIYGDAKNPDAAIMADAAPMCATMSSGVLATYSFSGNAGNEATEPAASAAPGIIGTPLLRSNGLVAELASSSFSSSNWPTSTQVDPNRYYKFSIVPSSTGCLLTLTSVSIDPHSSPNGPTMASVGTSADNFATKIPIATSSASTPALAVTNASGTVEIRIYGYAATTSGGTFRLDSTLTVSGSLK
jgi:hypothetical protein